MMPASADVDAWTCQIRDTDPETAEPQEGAARTGSILLQTTIACGREFVARKG